MASSVSFGPLELWSSGFDTISCEATAGWSMRGSTRRCWLTTASGGGSANSNGWLDGVILRFCKREGRMGALMAWTVYAAVMGRVKSSMLEGDEAAGARLGKCERMDAIGCRILIGTDLSLSAVVEGVRGVQEYHYA